MPRLNILNIQREVFWDLAVCAQLGVFDPGEEVAVAYLDEPVVARPALVLRVTDLALAPAELVEQVVPASEERPGLVVPVEAVVPLVVLAELVLVAPVLAGQQEVEQVVVPVEPEPVERPGLAVAVGAAVLAEPAELAQVEP